MASKMSKYGGGEDSIVGYTNKRVVNYTDDYGSDDDYENDDDFYDHYEPYEEDFDDDDGDYQPFIPEEEEHKPYVSPSLIKIVRPCINLNSPTKSAENSAKTSPVKAPTWWDKNQTIEDSKRIVNGVLNYAALLPPPTPKPKVEKVVEFQPKLKSKNKKKNGSKQPSENKVEKVAEKNPKQHPKSKPTPTTEKSTEVQKPTRFCLSVIKKSKCFHGAQCRFAHDYSDLKECNFGDKCKKVVVVKTNPDGTVELKNKNEVTCNFKHAKESKASYLKRIPQQHTSPKK